MRSSQAKSCYFDLREMQQIERISEMEQRPESQIVQFAVRVFAHLYETDRMNAVLLALGKPPQGASEPRNA